MPAKQPDLFPDESVPRPKPFELWVSLDVSSRTIDLEWFSTATNNAECSVTVTCTGLDELTWEDGHRPFFTAINQTEISASLSRLRKRFPTEEVFFGEWIGGKGKKWESLKPPDGSPWKAVEYAIKKMGLEKAAASFGGDLPWTSPLPEDSAWVRRIRKEEEAARELQRRIQEGSRRIAEKKREKQIERQKQALAEKINKPGPQPVIVPERTIPPVPLKTELPEFSFQETMLVLENLKSYFLREKAALWWVSNQSDDLLCLPYCRIQRLAYQVRTALRVIGALRGRALLSDEVGLGKTIEAGLVLKEYLTRGMVKRFLVLTVPSLVDQWAEELQDKFGIEVATTNQPLFRSDPEFWKNHHGIVASLHTVKQPAHLAVAQEVKWDLLIVDEAHYLRNRTSQAWSAVNALPRQFLLLLTATPVQNSLEELYNLVTLLQPGQLPSPKEFRDRFVDKTRPHQPREPEELRRLLGQVMIRNTRANAGIQLPPRRAEVVIFEASEEEKKAWDQFEQEFREALKGLNPNQASLWGRLLLQASGSSPQAWRKALESFPIKQSAKAWASLSPFEASWRRKTELVLPLAKMERGVVIFTQFLETQAALNETLRSNGISVFLINGQTPPPERQPITEQFRKEGGALLLTHSGTEGRNLQFCHQLVNFDLPWNPMEIEQRIGRLHRIGQEHPVRIYNLVQAGSLQEHLLNILQEKLNLFELVVGETGLILGDRFTSDEFAEEVLRRWRDSNGQFSAAFEALGQELAGARAEYQQVKALDETLFAKDYESL